MVNVLKQPQYSPLPVEKQVAIIYVGEKGVLDKLPADRVSDYEKGFSEYLEAKHAGLLQTLREKKELSDDVKAGLDKAIAEYQEVFV